MCGVEAIQEQQKWGGEINDARNIEGKHKWSIIKLTTVSFLFNWTQQNYRRHLLLIRIGEDQRPGRFDQLERWAGYKTQFSRETRCSGTCVEKINLIRNITVSFTHSSIFAILTLLPSSKHYLVILGILEIHYLDPGKR